MEALLHLTYHLCQSSVDWRSSIRTMTWIDWWRALRESGTGPSIVGKARFLISKDLEMGCGSLAPRPLERLMEV